VQYVYIISLISLFHTHTFYLSLSLSLIQVGECPPELIEPTVTILVNCPTEKSLLTVDKAVDIMNKYPATVQVQTAGCTAIMKLAHNVEKDFQDRLVSTGGPAVVLEAMRRHKANVTLQDEACRAIAALAAFAPSKLQILEHDGVQVVTKALGLHGSSPSVQEHAFRALLVLMVPLGLDDDPMAPVSETSHAMAEAILAGMRQHMAVSAVCEHGCRLLAGLAGHTGNQALLGSLDSIEVVVSAMRAQPMEAEVQLEGCRSLFALSCNDDNEAAVVTRHGVEEMVNAMRMHVDVVDGTVGVKMMCA
jgi:hypothetical protein